MKKLREEKINQDIITMAKSLHQKQELGYTFHAAGKEGDTYINAHSHGFDEIFEGAKDIQIVMGLSSARERGELYSHIVAVALYLMKEKNIRWKHNDVHKGDFFEYVPVKFIDAKESGRDVLRLILPDPAGEIEQDRMEPRWAKQYTWNIDGKG